MERAYLSDCQASPSLEAAAPLDAAARSSRPSLILRATVVADDAQAVQHAPMHTSDLQIDAGYLIVLHT